MEHDGEENDQAPAELEAEVAVGVAAAQSDPPDGETRDIQEAGTAQSESAAPTMSAAEPGTMLPVESQLEPEAAIALMEIPQDSMAASGSWRRRGERVTNLDLSREDKAAGTNGTGSGSNSGGEGGHEGPLTPRNDAGPFVFDGGALDGLALPQVSDEHCVGEHHDERGAEWRPNQD